MSAEPLQITVSYDPIRLSGVLERTSDADSTAWERIRAQVFADQSVLSSSDSRLELAWPDTLSLLRDFGSKAQQRELNFRFVPTGDAVGRIKQFGDEVRAARSARNTLTLTLSED